MNTAILDDPAIRLLDYVFGLLRSQANERGFGSTELWPQILGLICLRFLASPQTAGDWVDRIQQGGSSWNRIISLRGSGDISGLLQSTASEVEEVNPELKGVFTDALLPGIERLGGSLLYDWAHHLLQISQLGIPKSMFAQWLSEQISEQGMQQRGMGAYLTPPSVARLMVQLAEIQAGASVLDPCCGFGTVLTNAVNTSNERKEAIHVFGQELLPVSWGICKLRLFFLDSDAVSIILGDALRQPAFTESDNLRRFDRVLCDAPFGMTLKDLDVGHRDRFNRFVFSGSGRGSSENAFAQHAVASMVPSGKAVLLVSHGFLFRSGADARTREGFVKSGLIQSIVGLPAKLLPLNAIETALVVLGKNSTDEILFVDGSRLQDNVRGKTELSPETIEQLVKAVRDRSDTDISRCIPTENLAEADFNLLPRRYVSLPAAQVDIVNVNTLWTEIKALDAQSAKAAEKMDVLIEQLQAQLY